MNNDAVKKVAVEDKKPILILGGTGKTGHRVAERLTARGLPIRIGSRSGEPSFDWEKQSTWCLCRNSPSVCRPDDHLLLQVGRGRN